MILIDQPVITEKSLAQAQGGVYTFMVHDRSTKPEIAKTIAKIYGVEVTNVRTQMVKGKVVRRKTGLAKQSDWKKALVTVKSGQKIKDFDLPEKVNDADKKHDHDKAHDHKHK